MIRTLRSSIFRRPQPSIPSLLTILLLLAMAMLIVACGGSSEAAVDATSATPAESAGTTAEADASAPEPAPAAAADEARTAEGATEPQHPVTVVEFPAVTLDAEPGQYVFAPGDSSLIGSLGDDQFRKGKVSWNIVRVTDVGDSTSTVNNSGTEYEVHNAYLVPIPKEQAVEVGDLVLTSKFGNSMERAYVTEAGDSPKANFTKKMPYGENIADLKPGRYIRLTEAWQPGTAVAVSIPGQSYPELGTLLRVEGDQVLVSGHQGKMITASKSGVRALPPKVDVAAGDTVTASRNLINFAKATINEVDSSLGFHHLTYEGDDEVKLIPFGEVTRESFD